MPSLSATELPKFVTNLGYRIVADEYQPDAAYYPKFTNVMPIAGMSDAPYGDKSVGLIGVGTPSKRRDGEQVQSQRMGEGYPILVSADEYADEIEIPDSLLEAENAQSRVEGLVRMFVASYAKNAIISKDLRVAGMLQKGTLSAGSAEYFDGSYVGNADTYPKFVYDGKPWFAATGNAHPLKGIANTGSQGVNLTVSLALSATNLDTVLTAMSVTNAVDERGKRVIVNPRYLIVPRGLRTTALQILQSEGSPADATNAINAMKGTLEPLIHPYLTDDSDAWWVTTADSGLNVFDSGAPSVTVYRNDSRKVHIVQCAYRFGAGVRDWRGAYAANKAVS